MQDADSSRRYGILLQALQELRSALDLLDCASAPAHIGARIDQATHELDRALAAISGAGRMNEVAGTADH